jgi:hypothetical protein
MYKTKFERITKRDLSGIIVGDCNVFLSETDISSRVVAQVVQYLPDKLTQGLKFNPQYHKTNKKYDRSSQQKKSSKM